MKKRSAVNLIEDENKLCDIHSSEIKLQHPNTHYERMFYLIEVKHIKLEINSPMYDERNF